MRNSKKLRAVMMMSSAVATIGPALWFASGAQATQLTYTYVGANGSSWADAPNWNPNTGVPGQGDGAFVQVAGGNLGVTLIAPTSVGQLVIGTPSGSPFSTNIGNGSSANRLTLDNTGGNNNTDSFPANANPTLTSGGVAGATNILSAPLGLTGAPAGTTGTTNIAYASTNSLNLAGGIVIDNNTTTVAAAGTLGTNGVQRFLQVNLTGNKTLTINGITSAFSITPVGTPTSGSSVTITNLIQFQARNDNNTANDAGTIDFTRANYGTISISNVTDGTNVVVGPTTYKPVTQLGIGTNASNVGNSIATFMLGSNSFTGGFRLGRGNIYLGSDNSLGANPWQFVGTTASGVMGCNFFSTDDARSIANPFSLQRNFTVRGDHSLKFTGIGTQSNSSTIFNLLPTGKQFELTNTLYTANGSDVGRPITFDGTGKTIVSGSIQNNQSATLNDTGNNGQVIKSGDGLLILKGANTYRNFTAVNGGILEFADANAIGSTNFAIVNAGGAMGVDIGATTAFTHPTLGSISMIDLMHTANQPSTGAIALSSADAAANLNFTTGNLADPNAVGMSIGALPSGVSYTGTITPAAAGYRLGGGATLTIGGANKLTGANALTVTNGGAVVLSASNNFTGNTTIQSVYIISAEQQAAANNGSTNIATNPTFVPPGVIASSTLVVSSIADGASGIGNPSNSAASNLTLSGGTLKVNGTGGTSSRLFTLAPLGGTIDSSGSAPVVFNNTGIEGTVDASTTMIGTLTTGSNQIATVTDSSGIDINKLAVGMTVSGTNIQNGTTITGIRPSFGTNNAAVQVPNPVSYTIFISQNPTASAASTALTFGAQNRTLNLTGTNAGANTIAGSIVNSANGTVGVSKSGGGAWTLSGSNTYTGTTSVSVGTLTLKGANAHAPVLTGAGGANITGGRLSMDYTGGSSPISTVRTAMLTSAASGFTTGQFKSTGITTATRTLGYYDNGSTVDVAITQYGDGNLDGIVNALDFNAFASTAFGSTTSNYQNGDFNNDGTVNTLDFNAVATNFGQQIMLSAPIAESTLGSLVPEPMSISLLVAAAVAGLGRRRRA